MIEDRWRNARVAFVIGAIAVIALGLMAFVLSTSRGASRHAAPPMLLTEVPPSGASMAPSTGGATVAATSLAPTTTAPPSSRATDLRTTLPRTTEPVRTTSRARPSGTDIADAQRDSSPCPTRARCVLAGDAQVISALTAYRHGHGQPGDVRGDVTSAAQHCAVTGGDGPTCRQPFAVARESEKAADRAITDIGTGIGNWLLDPQLGSVEVGWAYQPDTGEYVCAILERP